MRNSVLTLCLLATLAGGALYSHHLTALILADASAGLACSSNAMFDCGKNLHSAYGTVFGIPVSAVATAFFLFLFAHTLMERIRAFRKPATQQTSSSLFAVPLLSGYLAGAVAAFYLLISIFVLHSICSYCAVLDGLIVLTTSIAFFGMRLPLRQQPAAFVRAISHLSMWRSALEVATAAACVAACSYAAGIAPVKNSPSDLAIPAIAKSSEPIAVTEFGDFECLGCKLASQEIEQLQAMHPGRINIQFVNYPLCHDCNPDVSSTLHPHACLAARIGIVMKAHGKFEPYRRSVFTQFGSLDERGLYEIVTALGEPAAQI